MENIYWLPKCLKHLNQPYIKSADDLIVIGEVSSEAYNGNRGTRKVCTALVPLERIQDVLNNPGGIGHEVESRGPRPSVKKGDVFKSDFWVRGTKSEERFESLIVSWEYHNKTVMMPDNGLLMCYGLCPRIVKNPDQIIWDNLALPEYGIVYVKPLSHYDFPSCSGCSIKIDQRYLEDYASLKNCAVIAVFYEERYCGMTDELEKCLNGQKAITMNMPGRLIDIKHMDSSGDEAVLCQIWGCRLVLTPESRPISDEMDVELEWPDYSGAMTLERAKKQSVNSLVYINDQVLDKFEREGNYNINPKTGSVSYDGWWALSHCHRIGRDYIAYEIKKIYEGCPSSIIHHLHRYAVPKKVVISQQQKYGDENIGNRAEKLINSFEDMGLALINICNSFGLTFEESDIIGLNKSDVEYKGWWTLDTLKSLGYRVPLDISRDQFLQRCKEIYKLFEGLKEKSLRRFLLEFGMKKEEIKCFKSLRLLATIMQLCSIALESGLDLVGDRKVIIARWDRNVKLEELEVLFALVSLRNLEAHILSEEKVEASLKIYEIDSDNMSAGWGIAVDLVYDKLTENLVKIVQILERCVDD